MDGQFVSIVSEVIVVYTIPTFFESSPRQCRRIKISEGVKMEGGTSEKATVSFRKGGKFGGNAAKRGDPPLRHA